MKSQRIKTRSDVDTDSIRISGWLSGKRSYLRFEDINGDFLGSIAGQKLYRLAKAIVKQFEADNAK